MSNRSFGFLLERKTKEIFVLIVFCSIFHVNGSENKENFTRPLIIGHRGVAYLPESTISALSMSFAYQSDMIEIDVCLSRDNQLVVIHDIYLNSMTNVEEIFPNRKRSDGFHYVIDFDLEEIRKLKVFERIFLSNKSSVFPSRFPSNSNVHFNLLTLNETIELILGLNYATNQRRELLIEIKKPEFHFQHGKSISEKVLQTLNAFNLTEPTDPIIIQTFHIEELIRIRQVLQSRLRLFALMTFNYINESSSDYDFYRSEQGIRLLSKFVQALTPFYPMVVDISPNGTVINKTNLTKWAHENHLAVYPFTFRRDLFPGENFQFWIEYFWFDVQVDGFITDHPDLARQIVDKRFTSNNHRNLIENFANRSSKLINYFLMIFTLLFEISN